MSYYKAFRHEISFRRWILYKAKHKDNKYDYKLILKKNSVGLGAPDFIGYIERHTHEGLEDRNQFFIEVKYRAKRCNPETLLREEQKFFFGRNYINTFLAFRYEGLKGWLIYETLANSWDEFFGLQLVKNPLYRLSAYDKA